MKTGIHHFGIMVSDLDKVLPFYQDIFGMKIMLDTGIMNGPDVKAVMGRPDAQIRLVYLKSGDQTFELIQLITPPGKPIADNTEFAEVGRAHLAIFVEDIEGFYKEMEEKGVRISCPIQVGPDIKLFYIRDPDGLWVEIVQPLTN